MISFNNVSVTFGDKEVLKNFTLELGEIGVTCISGPSGSGKTTLFRVIAGLCGINSGSYNTDFKKPALMFQEDRLFPWLTVLENVEAVRPGDTDGAVLRLEELGIGNEKNALPSELSGGMLRRVALARTLHYEGDILLLDEPFKGLDYSLIERVASIITAQETPALVISHSSDEIRLLGGKKITFLGPPLSVSGQDTVFT